MSDIFLARFIFNMRQRILLLAVALLLCFSPVFPKDNKAEKKPRPTVALVLGGGGAKGAAEVGVLKYIEESGVPIDFVVGTSIGSIVGGLYSMGYSANELDSIFRSQEWISLLADRDDKAKGKFIEKKDGVVFVAGFPLSLNLERFKRGNRFHLGALKGDSIVSTIHRMILQKHPEYNIDSLSSFDNMPIPYRCVAVDLNTFEDVVLDKGNLPLSMRASMAIPLAFRPIDIDNRTLIDGGVLNNLPVDVARAMGADYVIAVDLTTNKHEKADPDGYVDDDPDGLFSPLKKMGLLTMLKWQIMRPDIKRYRANCKQADIYINPELKGYNAADFKPDAISIMISRGEEAGKDALKSLKKLKKKVKR